MKRLFLTGALMLFFVPNALAQGTLGTIDFRTRFTARGLDAPVSVFDQGPGPAYSAGLFHDGILIPGSVTTFFDPVQNPIQNPLLAKYVVPIIVSVPGTASGQENFPVEMRMWFAAAGSYENAPPGARGSSGPLVIAELGGGANENAANHLPPIFTGFIIMPEPSATLLGTLAAALLITSQRIRDRRKRALDKPKD